MRLPLSGPYFLIPLSQWDVMPKLRYRSSAFLALFGFAQPGWSEGELED